MSKRTLAAMLMTTIGVGSPLGCTSTDRLASEASVPPSQPTTQPAQPVGISPTQGGLPSQLVQDLHSAFGKHHARAVHAKGVILEGNFVPTPDAKNICRAAVFDRPVPIVVRFSDFTGIPNIPDTAYEASPRGFAVKFLMPDGSNLDIVSHSFNGFPVATAKEFGEFLRTLGVSGPNSPKPTALDRFLESHPITKTFLTTQKPPPASYATVAYYGVNAFQFTDQKMQGRYVRYRFIPDAGEHYLDAESLKTKSPNYLTDEIGLRVEGGAATFSWYAQLGESGDAIENPSIAWPESRRLVKLGTLTINRLAAGTPSLDKDLLFLPGSLLPGIEAADPMVTIRNATYPISAHERQPGLIPTRSLK